MNYCTIGRIKMHNSLDYTTEDPLKLFLKICVPTTTAMLISALYVIADGIFIGRGIGQNGLAAVNIIVPIFTILTGISILFGFGSSTLSAIKLSASNKTESDNILSETITFAFIFTLILSIIIFIYSNEVALILGTNLIIHDMSVTYLRTLIIFGVFFMLNILIPYYLRLDGAAKYAMVFSLIGGLINIGLDYIFIFIFKWGVFGAAFATGIGNVISSVFMLYYIFNKSINFKINIKRFTKKTLIKVADIGFPGLLTEFSISAVTVGFNLVLMRNYTEVGVSAYSVINYVHPLMLLIFMGISQSMQPIISYNFGAEKLLRVKSILKIGLIASFVIGLLAVFVGFSFASNIVSTFLDSGYESYSLAVNGLPLFFIGYGFLGINMVVITYFQSITQPHISTLITVLRGLIIVFILLFTLPGIIGINGIWLSVPIAEFVGTILSFALLYKTSWKKHIILSSSV
jgi:putative MATE family efflux protein